DAVLERPHARARETANDRPRCAAAEIRRAHAELARERFAERRCAHAVERLAAQYGNRLREVAEPRIASRARDDDLLAAARVGAYGLCLHGRRRAAHRGRERRATDPECPAYATRFLRLSQWKTAADGRDTPRALR